MATEVWFRNPRKYTRQLAEYAADKLVWLRGDAVKLRVDPVVFTKGYYGTARSFRLMVIGTPGAHEYDQNANNEREFKACYPVWQYGEPLAYLETLLAENVADNEEARDDPTVDAFYRPLEGQEHRVVVIDAPGLNTGAGRMFFADLGRMQVDFPDAIIHVSGPWSWNAAFGFDFRSVDVDPHFYTGKNKLILPNGREINPEQVPNHGMWVQLLGFKASPDAFDDLEEVIRYNIASAQWAGKYYTENEKFRLRHGMSKNELTPVATNSVKSPFTSRQLPALQPADMVTCETCSRANNCKFYRAGAVCSIDGASVNYLSRHFRTRDSGVIIDGLGQLVGMEIERIEEAREQEIEDGKLDRNLTKAIDSAFSHGTDLAKLVDPALRVPKLALQINNNSAGQPNIAVLASRAVAELEAKGIPRAQQTPAMIMQTIGMAEQEVVEAEVVDGS